MEAIWDWAAEHSHEVSPRGRIAAPVQEAYDAAHQVGRVTDWVRGST
ncbi:hypothetical protein [Rathayibacter sp. AY1G1]